MREEIKAIRSQLETTAAWTEQITKRLQNLELRMSEYITKVKNGDIFQVRGDSENLRIVLFQDNVAKLLYLKSKQYNCGGVVSIYSDSGPMGRVKTVDEYIAEHKSYKLVGNIFDFVNKNSEGKSKDNV
jgi:uncharacterized membrane protein